MFASGIVTQAELDELVRRGWEPERPPLELLEGTDFKVVGVTGQSPLPYRAADGAYYVQFFVATDLFKVMTGPDWE